jgi:hypothetical protein
MTSIPISELLTIIFVMVDDWYQEQGSKLMAGKVGKKPIFRDSEVITLVLAQDFIPYPAETQYLEFIRANYLALFPKLLAQSQFNRRARALQLMIEELRRYWITQKGWHLHTHYLLDTKPVPVLGYKGHKNRSDFVGHADYGKCGSRDLKYFGYKRCSPRWTGYRLSTNWFQPILMNAWLLKPLSTTLAIARFLPIKAF